MKFLIGLIIGGVITVIVAEQFAANVPDMGNSKPGALLTWVETATGQFKRGWAPSDDQPGLARVEPEPAFEGGDETGTAIEEGLDDRLPDKPLAADVQEPMVQLAGPEPLPPADGPEGLLLAGGPGPDAHAAMTRAADAIQQVWAPFRSQTSAEGFARRLSNETQHPFGIDRRGPGRYQVFFAYADEDERRRLLEQVRPLIGKAAP